MNQDDYRKIANKLHCSSDIPKVAAELGIDEELALIIFTQQVTRDATKRFYVVKNQISKISQAYERGTGLVELANKFGFPPVLLGYLLFLYRQVPRKEFWKYVRAPESIRDARTRKEIASAVEADLIYSPKGEEVQRERGQKGERKLFDWLDRRKYSYMTEKDIKGMKEYTKTPDILFMKQETVNGLKVTWIESKANFGDIVEMKKNLSKQLIPYVKLFGKGIVVYWFGYVTDVELPEGITVVDANFFTEAGHSAPVGIGAEACSDDAQKAPVQVRAPPPRREEPHRPHAAVPSCVGGRISGQDGPRPRPRSVQDRGSQSHDRRREHESRRPEDSRDRRREPEHRRHEDGRDKKREPVDKKQDDENSKKSRKSLFGLLE